MHTFGSLCILLVLSALQSAFPLRFYATTSPGLEQLLLKEVSALKEVELSKMGKCGVHFSGSMVTGMDALMNLRTSLRLMQSLNYKDRNNKDLNIESKEDLYDYIYHEIPWLSYFGNGHTFSVSSTLGKVSDDLSHSHFTSITIKNAIVDRLADESSSGSRPDVDTDDPTIPLSVYLHRGKLDIYRVLSGASSMHKRGYREGKQHKASLRESTAAALVSATTWFDDATNKEFSFADVMCGSGTLAIEAALMYCNCAPGLIAYDKTTPRLLEWNDVEHEYNGREEWNRIRTEAEAKDARSEMQGNRIYVNDIHPQAIVMAQDAANKAGVAHLMHFSNEDIDQYRLPAEAGVSRVITNPPWDKRLIEDSAHAWTGLGRFAKSQIGGSATGGNKAEMFCLAGEPSLLRNLEMQPSSFLAFKSAHTDLRFIRYEV